MNTKIKLLVVVCAMITLSFTFAATSTKEKAGKEPVTRTVENEPIGGFISERNL